MHVFACVNVCVCVTDVPECVLGGCVQAGVSMNVVCLWCVHVCIWGRCGVWDWHKTVKTDNLQ